MNRLEAGYIEFMYNATHPRVVCSNPPFQYFIDVDNFCNYQCKFCIRPQMERTKGLMPMETFKAIVDSIKTCYGYIPCIDIARQGEALISPNLTEMIRYAKRAGCHSTRVQTNASLLTEQKSRELIEAGLDKINFSFGSYDRNLYHEYQPGGDFEKTLRNILRFLELKREMGRLELETVISTVEFEKLADTKEEFVRIFSDLPFNKVKINQFDSWLGMFEEAASDNARRRIPKKDWPLCKLPWRILAFAWDGTAVACNNDYNNDYVLGDIHKDSVEEIWNGEKMRAFRKAQIDRRYEDVERPGRKLCSQCNAMFDDPARNGPTYPPDFVTGLREFCGTGVMGGQRREESRAEGAEMDRKYEFLLKHREEWIEKILSGQR